MLVGVKSALQLQVCPDVILMVCIKNTNCLPRGRHTVNSLTLALKKASLDLPGLVMRTRWPFTVSQVKQSLVCEQ